MVFKKFLKMTGRYTVCGIQGQCVLEYTLLAAVAISVLVIVAFGRDNFAREARDGLDDHFEMVAGNIARGSF